MATQEDIDRITSMAEKTEDVPQLKTYRQELLNIAASMANVVAQSTDSGVQQHASEMSDSAQYAAEGLRQRTQQLEIDQMDPDYERRKAERAEFAQQEQARQAEEAKQGMAQLQGLLGGLGGGGQGAAGGGGGLGGILGGLFGGGGGQQTQEQAATEAETPPVPPPQPPPSPTPEPPPIPVPQPSGDAGMASCKNCHAQVKAGAKFCPECGTQNPTVSACASCGQALDGSPKFCPNCGAPTAA
jgi:RNA polymerase subunit RPABC4/transcription elongation factor Spt4